MAFTDIRINALMQKLSPKLQAYALIMRFDRPIGTWLLLLPGWWAIGFAAEFQLKLFILFGLGALIMRGAGCIINDLWDKDLDGAIERTQMRPLVSGALSRKEAFLALFISLMAGLLILLQLSPQAIWIGVLSLLFVVVYPLMKRITWWPQMFLGFTFNFGALIGWAAAFGHLQWPALFLYAGGIFWTLGYDTIYAHQDKLDDAIVGVKSTARLFAHNSKQWISAFYVAAILLWAGAFISAGAPNYALFGLALPAAHFAWQLKYWDMDSQASSLRMFKANRDAGLLMLLVILLLA